MEILLVIGTRPEAIKMAPVYSALHDQARLSVKICISAQHRDLLDSVIDVFALPVHFDLDVMKADQDIHSITQEVIRGVRIVIESAHPQLVLVHGDTTTTFAAALAAFYAKVPVGHVEAGLRSFDKHRPFPEEMNRRLADQLSDYHYAPTLGARQNLLNEGFAEKQVIVTGNTGIDALLRITSRPYQFEDPRLEALGNGRRLLVVTAHRRESFGESFRQMCLAMRDLVESNDDLDVAFPVHPNPNVRAAVNETLRDHERVLLLEPLDYPAFAHLMKKSTVILTDSGGIQEEAPSLGKPVVVMRDVTERTEGIASGTAILAGTARSTIRESVQGLLDDREIYARMTSAVNPYGDGKAAHRIAEHIVALAG